MVTIDDLEVVRVVPTPRGLYVCARQAEGTHEYNFYISTEGRMEGKTSSGQWVELSDDASRRLETKVQRSLLGGRGAPEPGLFYLLR